MLTPTVAKKVSASTVRLSSSTDDRYEAVRRIDAQLVPKLSSISVAEVTPGARQFMLDAGLVRPGEEQLPDPNDPNPLMRTSWGPSQVVTFGEKHLVVMELRVEVNDGAGHWVGGTGSSREVLAVEKTAGGVVFRKFEDVFPVPETLRVGIGQGWVMPGQEGPPEDLYYVELSGSNVLAALKDIFTKNHYSGFSAKLISGGGGKAPFDPTPGRTWQVTEPRFDLRRGSSVEIADVYAGQLDGDFESYFQGSAGKVAPWNGHIRKVFVDGGWRDTLPRTGLGTPGARLSFSDAFVRSPKNP